MPLGSAWRRVWASVRQALVRVPQGWGCGQRRVPAWAPTRAGRSTVAVSAEQRAQARFNAVLSGRADAGTWALRLVGLVATLAVVWIVGRAAKKALAAEAETPGSERSGV